MFGPVALLYFEPVRALLIKSFITLLLAVLLLILVKLVYFDLRHLKKYGFLGATGIFQCLHFLLHTPNQVI